MIVQPSVTEAVVKDARPHTLVEPHVAKVVRVGSEPRAVRAQTTGNVVVTDERKSVVELGIPGPKGEQGPPGPSGGTSFEKTADQALGGDRVVRSTGASTVDYADNRDPAHGDDVLGLTLGAADAGQTIYVVNGAEVTEPSWDWEPLEPLYLGTDGLLTQIPPGLDAAFTLVVGFATSPISAMIRIEHPIYH